MCAVAKNEQILPVVKWAGGKRQLLDEITSLLPKSISSYCEPFLGGGAVLFSLHPEVAIVNDLNADLITVYKVIKEDVEALISSLKKHENTSEYFYALRNLDRDKVAYSAMSAVERASRLIYLNRTCFNGLYRVNSAGEFNTPFGNYDKPKIVNESVLRDVSNYFNSNSVTFYNEDFAATLQRVESQGFVYLDPPYDPLTERGSFTKYNKGGFDRSEQIRLKKCCDDLNARGIKFMLSNSATEFIKDLYKDYDIKIVKAKRTINSNTSKRGAIDEVLIRNYSN